MNPDVTRIKTAKFYNRPSVKQTVDLLTEIISAMYEND